MPGYQVKPPRWDRTIDMADDDPNCPLFLARAAGIFAANDVRFEVEGFFKAPLPVSTDIGLVYFLEDLPGLLRFLTAPSADPFAVGLWEQGIQTEFSFSAPVGGDIIEVGCSCTADREMDHTREHIPRRRLVAQMAEFAANYREGTRRYLPELLDEAWNQHLFGAVARLKTTIT